MALTSGSPTTGPLDLSQYISGVTDRAYKNWGRQDETLDWAKKQFAKNEATADTVSKRALDTQYDFNNYAKRDQDFYAQQYMPAMQEQLDFARGYTTPARMEANRGAAGAGGALAFAKQREASERALQGIGVNPASGRSQGLQAGLDAADAANRAALMTKSDRDTESLGQEYLHRAIQTGQKLPGQAVEEAGMGIAAGNQAVNAPLAATASGLAGMTNTNWENTGNDMYKEWSRAAQAQTEAGLKGQELDLKRQEAASKEGSGAGAAIGAGMGILGTVAGAYFGGPMGASLGGSLGSSLGSSMGGGISRTGRTGTNLAAQGGMMSNRNAYADGGKVYDSDDTGGGPLFNIGDRMETVGAIIPGSQPRLDMRIERNDPQMGTGEIQERGYHLAPTAGRRNHFFPDEEAFPSSQSKDKYTARNLQEHVFDRYDTGGLIDAFADGGEVDEEGNIYPPEMMEEEPMDLPPEEGMPPEQGNMVPPEASPSGGEAVDDVHAMVSEGEFVMPKDVTSWFGEKFMQNLINKARKEMSEPKAEGEPGPPLQAMALSPPSFQSEGASGGA